LLGTRQRTIERLSDEAWRRLLNIVISLRCLSQFGFGTFGVNLRRQTKLGAAATQEETAKRLDYSRWSIADRLIPDQFLAT
jgi:hypothetical protein